MQSKKIKQLIVLVVAFVALIAFYAWFSSYKDKKEEKESEKDKVEATEVFSVDANKLVGIEYKYKDKKYSLVYNSKDKKWKIKGKEGWPINQSTIESMISSITTITSKTDIKSTNKEDFGLDKPSKTVLIKSKNDDKSISTKLLFGNEAPNSLGHYCMVDGQEKIFVVDSQIYNAFEYDNMGLLNVETISGISSDGIYDVNVKGKKFNLKAKYDGDIKSSNGKWIIAKPYNKKQVGIESMFTEYFVNYESLAYGEKVVAYKPKDLGKYGLDKPTYSAEIKYYEEVESDKDSSDDKNDEAETTISDKKKTYSLLVGKGITEDIDDQGPTVVSYYVMKKGGDRVYTMDASTIESLFEQQAFDFVDKAVNGNDILNYEYVQLETSDKTYKLSKQSKKNKDSDGKSTVDYLYKFNDKEIEATYADKITNELYGFSYEAEIGSKKISKDKVIATLKYKGKEDGKKDCTIKFLNYDDSCYRVDKDGEKEFLVAKDNLDKLIKVFKEQAK